MYVDWFFSFLSHLAQTLPILMLFILQKNNKFHIIHIDLSKAKSPENEVNVISSLLAGPKFYKQEIFC